MGRRPHGVAADPGLRPRLRDPRPLRGGRAAAARLPDARARRGAAGRGGRAAPRCACSTPAPATASRGDALAARRAATRSSGSTSSRPRGTPSLRDRPGRYGAYLIADLTALAPAEEAAIRAARPQALACVGSVGGGHLPPAAVVAGAARCSSRPRCSPTRSTSGAARTRCATLLAGARGARARALRPPPHGHRRRAGVGGRSDASGPARIAEIRVMVTMERCQGRCGAERSRSGSSTCP